MPTTQNPSINKEAVKALVLLYGQREAARKAGLNENTVRSWAMRYKWSQQPPPPPQPICNRSPADALATVLAADSEATKIGFSKAARKTAEALKEREAEALLDKDTAQAAKHWHGIASGVHGWEEKQSQANVMVNIALLGIDPAEIEVEGRTVEQSGSNETGDE